MSDDCCKGCSERWIKEEDGKMTSCRSACPEWLEHEKKKDIEYDRRCQSNQMKDYKRERDKRIGKAMDVKFGKWRKRR